MKFDKKLVQVLCPFGEWNHARGMQVVDSVSAKRMKRNMLITSPFRNIPIYIGHPDDSPAGRRPIPVGKISKIFETHDGIAVEAVYDEKVRAKILQKEISAMSPRWQMEQLEDGKFRPIRLVSVGLTNNPNIPSSGKILSTKDDSISTLKNMQRISKIANTCQTSLSDADSCLRKSAELASTIKSEAVSERLKANKIQPKESRKKSVRELCDMAKQRSRSTGEPYTKSFAAVKRSIDNALLTQNKIK